MADSTASIKSIYSGRGDISDGEYDDISGVSLVPFNWNEKQVSSSFRPATRESSTDFKRFQDNFAALNAGQTPVSGITDPHSHHYTEGSENSASGAPDPRTSSGLDHKTWNLGPSEWCLNQISSTNVSLASLFSGPPLGSRSPSRAEGSEVGYTPSESYSRPLSRNSNYSAFSTIATKDGIEGKKPYKVGLKPLLETVLANKHYSTLQIQQHLHDSNTQVLPDSEKSPALAMESATNSGLENSKSTLQHQLDGAAYLPISINEKIEIMNRESITEN